MKDKAQFKQIDCMIQNKIYDLILATKDSVYIIITNNMYYWKYNICYSDLFLRRILCLRNGTDGCPDGL
jgi:hypothetical protein